VIYEIINPSDAVTIEADDTVLASIAIIVLGNGQYGLYDEDGRTVLGIFALSTPEKLIEWLRDNGVEDTKMDEFYAKNGEEIATILESVVYGDISDRKAIAALTESMTRSDRLKAMAKYNDSKRSSMNDIGSAACELAKGFRKKAQEAQR
jgi:hypothetical protein